MPRIRKTERPTQLSGDGYLVVRADVVRDFLTEVAIMARLASVERQAITDGFAPVVRDLTLAAVIGLAAAVSAPPADQGEA